MPTPFLDISFPDAIARGATGGPGFLTDVVALGSGGEQRNIRWADGKGNWNISTGIRTRAQMDDVIAFFRVAMGKAYSWRFKDWTDYKASAIDMVEVSSTVYQIVKCYTVGSVSVVRNITKPKSGTVAITVSGSPVSPTIDYLTGLATFGSAPGATPKATFEFDVPVRFDTDQLPVQANAYNNLIVPQIDIVEVINE